MYKVLFAILKLLSRLPLRVHYLLSDVLLYPLVFHVVRYRRRLVRRQLAECFPEKSEQERRQIMRRFYHFLCDYIVETLKMQTMSHDELRQRVPFVGIEELQATMEREGKQFGFCYLGHYGNWEWMSSFPLWFTEPWQGAQIYHPLRNRHIDQFFIDLRQQFGGRCIPMKQTLRQILTDRREGRHEVIGFIADQGPKWQAVQYWTDFLNHRTAFLTGAERIARQVGAAVCYLHVTRPRRGYYRAEVKMITTNPDEMGEFEITNRYIALIEQQIREQPELWLWTHDRWKRSYERWQELKQEGKI